MKGHLTCEDTIWCIEVSPAGRFDCVVVTCTVYLRVLVDLMYKSNSILS